MSLLRRHDGFIYLVIGLSVLFTIVIVVVLVTQSLGSNYSQLISTPDVPRQQLLDQQTFSVRRINLKVEGICGAVDILRSGRATKIGCDTRIDNSIILSNEKLQQLFGNLTKEEFDQLEEKYFVSGLDRTITLEIQTNFGTKTVTLSGSDTGAPPAPGGLDDIVEIIEEVEEELNNPTPTPPTLPSTTPTPTPPPGQTPTPTPSGTPTPTPPGATPEPAVPFSCSMLERLGVTVSNIRCLDE